MSNISKALSASKTVTRDAAGIIYINGYLTQKKLEQALRYAIGEGGFSGDEIPVNIPQLMLTLQASVNGT